MLWPHNNFSYQTLNSLFGLVLDTLNSSADGILISQISSSQGAHCSSLGDYIQIIIQFINKWGSGRNIQLSNGGLINVIKVLYKSTERVSVSSYKYSLSFLNLGNNIRLVVWKNAIQCGGKRLGEILREFMSCVTRITGRVMFTRFVYSRRGDVVTSTPDKNL